MICKQGRRRGALFTYESKGAIKTSLENIAKY